MIGDELLQILGHKLGVELKLVDNTCTIEADTVLVNITYDETQEELLLSSALSDLPATDNTELLRTLLEANYLGDETQGAALCLNPDNQYLMLQKRISCTVADADALLNMLTNFVNTAELFTKILSAYQGPKSDSADKETALSSQDMDSMLIL
ncbi:MAG: type III secretion system chaperone [Succinivibrio sp.]|nr:type III secretion system chaperone [Succinivibrio sp.]